MRALVAVAGLVAVLLVLPLRAQQVTGRPALRPLQPSTRTTVPQAAAPAAQAPPTTTASTRTGGQVVLAARGAAELRDIDLRMTAMMQRGDLRVTDLSPDRFVAGRRHESFAQYHLGIPVHASGLARQLAGNTLVSIFGRLQEDPPDSAIPALSPAEAATIIEAASGVRLLTGEVPHLVFYPTLAGAAVLAYQARTTGATTYVIDGFTGTVLEVSDERKYQSAIGLGTGVHGDLKKLSTMLVGGSYTTHDRRRPVPIDTLLTDGSEAALDRLLDDGLVLDSEYPRSATNRWTNAGVVDAHANTGIVYDYFARQHGWNLLDGVGRRVVSVVHAGLKDNAFFIPPPYGVGGAGGMFYGVTTSGRTPVTSLDIVGHELMHGVTHFGLTRRTGSDLSFALMLSTGPTTMNFAGKAYACSTSSFQGFPFYCSNGRYVMATGDPGAVDEAFSDVLGTAVEFSAQVRGTGPLKADYLMGEDSWGEDDGRTRSMKAPTPLFTGVPGQNHWSNRIGVVTVITGGTRAAPTAISLSPYSLIGSSGFSSSDNDRGWIHSNNLILGHAYYLAVEGGTNATSGLTVTGVGAANRASVEQAFFRAMTLLMPNSPTMPAAALAVYQSAVDLYGSTSATARALNEAFLAVGLF